jgi:hypothetical protein
MDNGYARLQRSYSIFEDFIATEGFSLDGTSRPKRSSFANDEVLVHQYKAKHVVL